MAGLDWDDADGFGSLDDDAFWNSGRDGSPQEDEVALYDQQVQQDPGQQADAEQSDEGVAALDETLAPGDVLGRIEQVGRLRQRGRNDDKMKMGSAHKHTSMGKPTRVSVSQMPMNFKSQPVPANKHKTSACMHAGRGVACGGHRSGHGADAAACLALSTQRRLQSSSGAAGSGGQWIGC